MDKYETRRLALKAFIDSLGRGGTAQVASRIGKDASYVSRMLYDEGKPGRKRIGEDTLEALARAYPEKFGSSISVSPVPATETAGDYVRVQHLDAEAGMGEGRINDDYPEVIRSMDFEPTYIRSVVGFVPPPGRLILITGRGDSMIPVIQPGESLIVDTGVAGFDGDGIYLINTGNGQQIKALQDRGDAIYVVSANAGLYPAFPLPAHALVAGKVYLRNRIDRLN
ncbi:helix-turn-helix transcriptional regulator [Xanthomonas hortorum pv. vitians]|uniref:S24 family peptidase n=1 Tax=Xanthomonas hortorum TaxID=56454 RepID=UPI001F434354|nr:helix-turn-helix transcriptional regulator [Xanthomonas hortorum]MCE4311062.1 helix-turn-helix transcriptional regulator [Xanthomonas hortorum pv. vitians]